LKSSVPTSRVRVINAAEANSAGCYVLYWMVANRRASWNYSLDRAIDWAEELGKPLLVFEALRPDYQWNCDRFHRFIVDGMQDNAEAFGDSPIHYYAYLQPDADAGRGALNALASQACVVVSDDFPCFFLPRMFAAAQKQIPSRFELVDSNGIYPMRNTQRVFSRAVDFRRHLQKTIRPNLSEAPAKDPWAKRTLRPFRPADLPEGFAKRWPAVKDFAKINLANLPIDHAVKPVEQFTGGTGAARQRLGNFLKARLSAYDEARNEPAVAGTSELSPYLHFGHVSSHEVFARLMKAAGWSEENLAVKATGSNSGWWGAPPTVEAYLDQLITWRELGYNSCALTDNYDQFESLPNWAQKTLADHAKDKRPYLYSLEQFESAKTHDRLWNAAQRQLVYEGRIQNYLRMLWGKKVLEWTRTPQEALEILIELNNKYALDGRNPNSYSGIFWVLGRYDRAWGPERPIFGKIRFMSSDNTARKIDVRSYLETWCGR
jgi:deoxyribodipyrimidine photo-lyase